MNPNRKRRDDPSDGDEPDTHAMARRGASPLLRLEGFGFAYGERVVARSVDLTLHEGERVSLMGPSGSGKSSLLRILAGLRPEALRVWGTARYAGQALGASAPPALVGQKARALVSSLERGVVEAMPERAQLTKAQQRARVAEALAEIGLERLQGRLDEEVVAMTPADQRCAGLARAYGSAARLVCVDEPCAGLDDPGRAAVLATLVRIAELRTVLLVTHNRLDALELGGSVALLAGGVIHERTDTARFFRDATSECGRQFGRTGSCSEPSPDAARCDLDEGFLSRAGHDSPPQTVRWVVPGRLAGFSRPGLLADAEVDLARLADLGIRVLISLEEQIALPDAVTRAHGFEVIHHPIVDMDAPTFEGARALCASIHELMSAGRPVGVHCRAGLGRTGTVLGAYLIWSGRAANDALDAIRRVEHRFVQSAAQLEFLRQFEGVCATA